MLKKIILFSFTWIIILSNPIYIKENQEQVLKENNTSYIGYLVIPSIDLNLGFYSINDERNDVSKNIEVLPNSEEGSLFIAGHSGVGKVAYFNELKKLRVNDEIIIQYNHQEYLYKVTDIWNEIKDGNIRVKKEDNEKILVLTTCDQIKKGYQLVIKAVFV